MPLGKSAAVVIGAFPLGESDLVVTFFTRQYGRIRGVARGARRMRSRFGGGLEIFTLGELLFFDGGRSELVQVDHFDINRPFGRVRDDLERLGEAAWIAECVARLTGEGDPNPALYGLLVRAFTAVEEGVPPRRVAVVFGARCVDALGHRLRVDRCVGCGGSLRSPDVPLAVDFDGGGVRCQKCSGTRHGALTITPPTLAVLRRLRTMGWSEATAAPIGTAEGELRSLLEAHVAQLIGRPTRASRFLREVAQQGAP